MYLTLDWPVCQVHTFFIRHGLTLLSASHQSCEKPSHQIIQHLNCLSNQHTCKRWVGNKGSLIYCRSFSCISILNWAEGEIDQKANFQWTQYRFIANATSFLHFDDSKRFHPTSERCVVDLGVWCLSCCWAQQMDGDYYTEWQHDQTRNKWREHQHIKYDKNMPDQLAGV